MRNAIIRIVLVIVALITPAIIGYRNPDIDTQQSLCPSKLLFDFPCPGCGLTKSIIHLYKGEILVSLQYHWWGWTFVVICFLLLVLSIYDLLKKQDVCGQLLDNVHVWQIFAILYTCTYLIRLGTDLIIK